MYMNDYIRTKSYPRSIVRAIFLLTITSIAVGCSKTDSVTQNKPSGPPERPPVQVDTVTVISKSVREYRVFTGRTAAAHSVEIRPRVGGYLVQAPNNQNLRISSSFGVPDQSRAKYLTSSYSNDQQQASTTKTSSEPFVVSAKEGDKVAAGAPLFQIDPRPFEFTLQQARGNLEALIAQSERLNDDLDRLRKLQQSNAISESEFELARANLEESAGQRDALEATVRRAELDLEFTQIRAPMSGTIGRTLVTPANVVSADTTILTTIVSTNPIHVFFDLDEASFLKFRAFVKESATPSPSRLEIPVSLALTNESGYPHSGKIDFQNNTTDPGSGNTLIRAEFDNSLEPLSPGLFCRVQVPFSEPKRSLLIPTKCLAMDQQGKYVMIVDQNNKVTRRSITTGVNHGLFTIIASGLEEGDTVIYEGLQKVRSNDRVTPTPSSSVPIFSESIGPGVE